MITQQYLKDCLAYCPESGIFTWLERPEHHFKTLRACHLINTRFAGTKAGSIAGHGYILIGINNTMYGAHRLAFIYVHGFITDKQIDHINGIRTDNRISNIRLVTPADNQRNQSIYKNNTSGVMGVSWIKAEGKWRAYIQVNGVKKHLGYFNKKELAIETRKNAEIKYGFHANHGKICC